MDPKKLDRSIEILHQNKERWLRLPVAARIGLLTQLIDGTELVARRQVRAAIQAKGIPAGSPAVAEDWLGGPMVTLRNLRLLKKSLQEVERLGTPVLNDEHVSVRPDGQVVAQVFPASLLDKLMYKDFRAEIWMEPEVTRAKLKETMAVLYQNPPTDPKVALVLGAGNVASIGPLDVIYKLFVEGQVCLLKLNPVNDYLGPFIEESFHCLIKEGFLEMAYGGADVGEYLCQHKDIDEIHITGSDKTHDVIVYGPGEEGQARKKRDEPQLNKRITSELGNVSPVIVVPGNWSTADLHFHAENVATQMTNNGGFNCNASKVLITHEGWAQRESFMEALRHVLRNLEPRKAYYPGAEQRYSHFLKSHPNAEPLGAAYTGGPDVPWTLIPNVDPNEPDAVCFQEESFCGITAETAIAATDASDFLQKAVAFCNDTLWGTLSACVIIHPDTERRLGSQLEEAIATLRYGCICINHWPALGYGLGCTTWGAFPGHTRDDIQSGVGVVHNTMLFDKPQKSVIYGPFRVFPKPPWFVTNRRADKIAPILTKIEHKPSLLHIPALLSQVLRS